MKKNILIVLNVTFIIVFANTAKIFAAPLHDSSVPVDSALAIHLQKALDDFRIEHNIIGLSAAVAMPDGKNWVGASGMSDPINGDTLRTDMVLWASLAGTRMFTAAAVLLLEEQGKLTLDDSLHQWLPSFPNIDSTLSIRQLLNYGLTTGIADVWLDDDFRAALDADYNKHWTQEEVLSFVKPDGQTGYYNTEYVLAGMIIEEATGLYFPVAMEQLFGHYDFLHDTYFAWSDTIPNEFVHPWYAAGGGEQEDISHWYAEAWSSTGFASSTLITTPHDLARFLKHLFAGDIVTSDLLNEMLPDETLHGLGFGSGLLFGREVWGHAGWDPGYRSVVSYTPADSISIAVMSNDEQAYHPYFTDMMFAAIYSFDHPHLVFDEERMNLGFIQGDAPPLDTTFMLYNIGGARDSIVVSITNSTAAPNAVSVSPATFGIAPGDSQAITFTLNPELLNPAPYNATVAVESQLSFTTPSFSKLLFFIIQAPDGLAATMDVPVSFELEQNYPNPFNPSTTIRFAIATPGHVSLKIYNLLGEEVETLVNEKREAGEFRVEWDAGALPSGLYFCRLQTSGFEQIRKLILQK